VIRGMIVTMFPEPREQAKAIGVFTIVDPAAQQGRLAGTTTRCRSAWPSCPSPAPACASPR
jgi:hypothetical protein